jgi:hypothetical protein
MTPRRTVLRVEELGNRILPSVTLSRPVAATTAIVSTQTLSAKTALNGEVHGRYTIDFSRPTTGKVYSYEGTASITGLGLFAVKGQVRSVGSTRSGTATGSLTFSSRRGSFTMVLDGPTQPANAALPQKYRFRVTGGTGLYRNLTTQGEIQLKLQLFYGYNNRGHFDLYIKSVRS